MAMMSVDESLEREAVEMHHANSRHLVEGQLLHSQVLYAAMAILAVVAATAGQLYMLGRRMWCACCAAGFWLAGWLGLRKSLVLFLAVELLLIVWIKDNLTLNVVMLLYPLEAVKTWQTGG